MPASPSPSPSPKRKGVAGRQTDASKPLSQQPPARSAPVRKAATALAAPRIDALKRVKRVVSEVSSSRDEQRALNEIKASCASSGLAVKKSSLWRIGIGQLEAMSVETLRAMLASLPPLKKKRLKK